MSGAHTPGPWIKIGKIVGVKDGELASVWDLDGCQDENAQLIAAAPELLEALKTIKKFASINHVNEFSRRFCFASIQLEAQDAIAKATGAAE